MTNHPTRATTYTVTDQHGSVLESKCTFQEAAEIVLQYDGHEYDIRPPSDTPDAVTVLWVSGHSRNAAAYRGLTASTIISGNGDPDQARDDIFGQVIGNADWWSCRVLTDDEHTEILNSIDN